MRQESLGEALAKTQRRARIAKWGLGSIAFLSVFMAISVLLHHWIAYRASGHGEIDEVVAALNLMNQGLVVLVYALVFVITAVAFMMWLHAAYKILPDLGAKRLEYTPGQAASSFLIPFIWFFRPYQVVREIWFSSDQENPDNPVSTPIVLRLWWGLFLLHWLLDRLEPRANGSSDDLANLTSYGNIGPDVVRIAAALAAICVVRSIMDRQERRVAQLLFPSGEETKNDSITA